MASAVIDVLLASEEPSIRWKTRANVLGEDADTPSMRRLREQVRRSARAQQLLDGHEALRPSTYAKWQGAHWVVATLADLGYPPGEPRVVRLCDEVLATWLQERFFRDVDTVTKARTGVPVINGRHRRCGSQQGSALLSAVRLGLNDGRCEQLVERLLHWQWPDGGWNCDPTPEAATSSVHETLLPMRGLAAFARAHANTAARRAADRAAQVLLDRRVIFHRSTGLLIHDDWAKVHYPPYWHYDVLAALKGLAELGHVQDDRCRDALEMLQRKQLPAGGWPAEGRYYRGTSERRTWFDHVDWGGADTRRMNEWVTVDTLAVLRAVGRLAVS